MTRGSRVESGTRYGRLVVLIETHFRPSPAQVAQGRPVGNRAVLCRCDCGAEKTVSLSAVRRGEIRSCGCFQREDLGNRRRSHGLRSNPHYPRWNSIRSRCLDPACGRYGDYGGRGITMHPAWVKDPTEFVRYVEQVLGPCPPGHSLDRIDNDGNYEPGNLRWADPHTQRINARPKSPNRRPWRRKTSLTM